MDGRARNQRNTYNVGITNRNFDITPPSNWAPVAAESNVTTVGANYTITLKRGNNSWKCFITNNLSL